MGRADVRVGLVGHGLAGAAIHAPLIEAVPGYRITAVATSRPDSLARRRDAPRAVGVDDLLGAEDVDLVVVASPNALHAEQAMAALRAGKHVVVDKPFVLTEADAEALIAAAARSDRLLSVFHNRRWDADYLAAKAEIDSGRLGEVLLVHASWDRFRPRAAPSWRNSEAAGAGLLWDLGPHLIDQALQLFGPPERVIADVAAQREGAAADDYFSLTLVYGRMRCVLSATSVVADPRPRYAVHGTAGSLVVPTYTGLEAALFSGGDVRAAALPDGEARFVDASGRRTLTYPAASWTGFYEALLAAIASGGPPPVSPEDALAGLRLISAAHAAASGTPSGSC